MLVRKMQNASHAELLQRVGSAVRTFREARGFTQKQLAEKANVTQSAISMIESGHRTGNTNLLLLLRIVASLDVGSLGEFFVQAEKMSTAEQVISNWNNLAKRLIS
jgi:transcriptional regulator with XRE-family HTH domain